MQPSFSTRSQTSFLTIFCVKHPFSIKLMILKCHIYLLMNQESSFLLFPLLLFLFHFSSSNTSTFSWQKFLLSLPTNANLQCISNLFKIIVKIFDFTKVVSYFKIALYNVSPRNFKIIYLKWSICYTGSTLLHALYKFDFAFLSNTVGK